MLLAGCAGESATAPELELADRFEIVAFEPEDPFFENYLWRWERPIRVAVIGSRTYTDSVFRQVELLGQLTGQNTETDSESPNITIEFSRRNREWYCQTRIIGIPTSFRAEIYIATDQAARHIERCIVQELSQSMGLIADTDGRRDTAFSSEIGTNYLTEADLALFAILYDQRLRAGMHRKEAMPIVRQIASELEAEQKAADQ